MLHHISVLLQPQNDYNYILGRYGFIKNMENQETPVINFRSNAEKENTKTDYR